FLKRSVPSRGTPSRGLQSGRLFAASGLALRKLGVRSRATSTSCPVPSWSSSAPTTAARATELGGKVIVPPFDAPWVRMTIITPAGRDVHRQHIRRREQAPRQQNRWPQRFRQGP